MEGASTDLALRCNSCGNFFVLPSAVEHKKYHRAMEIMGFREDRGPCCSLDSLTKRRKILLQKVLTKCKDTSTDSILPKQIEKINDAYETLRFEYTKDDASLRSLLAKDGMTSMTDGYFQERDEVSEVQLMTQAISTLNKNDFPTCIYGIGRSQANNTHWRNKVKVASSVNINKTGFHLRQKDRGSSCIIGMFDGYHGATASHTCAESIHEIICDQFTRYQESITQNELLLTETDETTSELVLSDADIAICLRESFEKMDEYLGHGMNENSRLRWSGCSALTCIAVDERTCRRIDGKGDTVTDAFDNQENQASPWKTPSKSENIGKVYVSNVGNVRAVLYHDKKAHLLSELHNLENEQERKRVTGAGGTVNNSGRRPFARVNNILGVTRGLGNHGDVLLKKCVIASPHTATVPVTRKSHMLVIATDSVWKVLNPRDVYSVLIHSIPSDPTIILGSGPKPEVPIIHGSFIAKKGVIRESETPHIARLLPSIIESEEEQGIEEVIFVEAQESDSDDEDILTPVDESIVFETARTGCAANSNDSLIQNIERDREEVGDLGESQSVIDDSMSFSATLLGKNPKQIDLGAGEKYATIASVLSEQLTRAALCAGATDDISVVVILFEGMFCV